MGIFTAHQYGKFSCDNNFSCEKKSIVITLYIILLIHWMLAICHELHKAEEGRTCEETLLQQK